MYKFLLYIINFAKELGMSNNNNKNNTNDNNKNNTNLYII